jgi:hypothetical protein
MTSLGFPKQFDKNIASVIALFLTSKPQKFLDWIQPDKLNWAILSRSLDESILKNNLHKINWYWLSYNTNGITLLTNQIESPQEIGYDQIDWFVLSMNPAAIPIIEKHPDRISWKGLSGNKNAIHLLEKFTNNFTTNLDKLSWSLLCKNENAIHVVRKYFYHADIVTLCLNPNAITLLKEITDNFTKTMQYQYWSNLCANPNAISVIEEFLQSPSSKRCISWFGLSSNPNAIHLLEKNPNLVHWRTLCMNPNALHILSDWKTGEQKVSRQSNMIFWNELSFNKNLTICDPILYNSHLKICTRIVYDL